MAVQAQNLVRSSVGPALSFLSQSGSVFDTSYLRPRLSEKVRGCIHTTNVTLATSRLSCWLKLLPLPRPGAVRTADAFLPKLWIEARNGFRVFLALEGIRGITLTSFPSVPPPLSFWLSPRESQRCLLPNLRIPSFFAPGSDALEESLDGAELPFHHEAFVKTRTNFRSRANRHPYLNE